MNPMVRDARFKREINRSENNFLQKGIVTGFRNRWFHYFKYRYSKTSMILSQLRAYDNPKSCTFNSIKL